MLYEVCVLEFEVYGYAEWKISNEQFQMNNGVYPKYSHFS